MNKLCQNLFLQSIYNTEKRAVSETNDEKKPKVLSYTALCIVVRLCYDRMTKPNNSK